MLPRPSSIRTRLALLALVVALPLLAILIGIFAVQLRRARIEARESALRVARDAAARLEVLQGESAELLAQMSSRPLIRAADPNRCDSLFAIVDFFPQYVNLFLFDRRGRLLCAADPQVADRAASAFALDWLQAEIGRGTLPIGRPRLRVFGNGWVSVLAEDVVQRNGRRVGVLAIVQRPDLPSEPRMVMTILDERGALLAREGPPVAMNPGPPPRATIADLVLRERQGTAEAIGTDGVQRQYGFTRIEKLGWHIYVGIPTEEVMRPVRGLFLRGAVGGAAITLALLVFALALSRSIERPIESLSRAAGKLAERDVLASQDAASVEVPPESPREIVVLSGALQQMIRRRSEAESQLVESQERLKGLSDRLLEVQEEERARIARELHDHLGQSLTALKMDVEGLVSLTAEGAGRSDGLRERIARTLQETLESVQRISAELRPSALDDLGLAAALESEAKLFEERNGIECELSIPALPLPLGPGGETAVYRITQEALTNVARHSDASRVEVRIRQRPEELVLEVRDNGRGIPPEKIDDRGSLGLIGMRERATSIGGTVHVEGIAGRGTIVTLRVPLAHAGDIVDSSVDRG